MTEFVLIRVETAAELYPATEIDRVAELPSYLAPGIDPAGFGYYMAPEHLVEALEEAEASVRRAQDAILDAKQSAPARTEEDDDWDDDDD